MADLETFPEDWDRALAVVAHPDDMEYGAAAAVARWTGQGKHIAYVAERPGDGLEIYTLNVGGGESVGDLARDIHGPTQRDRPELQLIQERLPFEQLGDRVVQAVR